MKVEEGEPFTESVSKRIWIGLVAQIKVSLIATLATLMIAAVYNIWILWDLFVEVPHDIFVDAIRAAWLFLPTFFFALLFTIGFPIATFFFQNPVWQMGLIFIYQVPWFLVGLVSVFWLDMLEPSPQVAWGALILMGLCIIGVGYWGLNEQRRNR